MRLTTKHNFLNRIAVILVASMMFFGSVGSSMAQTGGTSTFQFLDFVNSARSEAVGGYLITIKDNDATLGVRNPALINKEMHGMLAFNYVNYFADTRLGFTSYARHFKNVGTFTGTLLYANYGQFEYADINGERNGSSFSANDLALNVGYGYEIDSNFSIGASFKFGASFLESYNAFGVAGDLAAHYQKKSKGFGAALLIRNVGLQLNSYVANNREAVPFNVLLSMSKKLEHAPFRFSLTYQDLHRWNVIYFDPNQAPETDPLTGDLIVAEAPSFGNKLMRHLIFSGEMILSENFHFRFGYNYKKRIENKVAIKPGLTGISWGFGLKVKKFHLSYALSKSHLAGTSNHITMTTRIGKPASEDTFYRQD